jgi:hypothetical protein
MLRRGGLWAGLLLAACALRAADETNNTVKFGFKGPEIFPIDTQISLLHAADIDGDGLGDLIVVNNSQSKINILYNQTGKTNTAAPKKTVKREINELPPDARFRIDSIASEKRISSLVVRDLNSDGKPDLAYYGEPKELVVLFNQGTDGWSAPKRFAIDDGQSTQNALTSGDLNGDKRTDLVLLGESCIYFLPQQADHTLGEPGRIPFSGAVKAIEVLDIDGDGRDDLLLINWDNADPFRFRLQNAEGQLGPEIHFALSPIRSFMAKDLDGDNKTEIVTVAQNSGRAQVSNFIRKPAEQWSGIFRQGQFQVMPLNKASKAKRGILWADVNGDGLADLLVAEPDSGQLSVYLQKPDGSLASAKTFPTLTGVSQIAVSDWNNDGTAEIFLLSTEENQVGVTHFDKSGRVAFPTILTLPGKPLVMTTSTLKSGARPSLIVLSDQDGKRALVTIDPDLKSHSQELSKEFKGAPTSITSLDADQDGLTDLVILTPYEKIKVMRQVADKPDLDEIDILPPGGSTEQPWLSVADIDGDGKPELLLAQKNFLRAVVMKVKEDKNANGKQNWTFEVKEQINGASSSSKIVGATPLRNGTNAISSIFLFDAERKAVTLCERDAAGVWQVVRSAQLPITDFSSLQPLGLGSTNFNALTLIGVNTVGTMALQGDVWSFNELDSYETPIKDGRLGDVFAGDINNDGRKDIIFLETAKNNVDIVAFMPPHKLIPGIRWKVFEERTFRSSRRGEGMEPREGLVFPVTGSGKNDLLILVHDRVLLYPQE